MRIHPIQSLKTKAFTLIEMIGVLAVIAILAALLIPKIFQAINDARVNNAAVSCQTVKTAIADHYAKFGSIPVNGTAIPAVPLAVPAVNYDQILLGETFIDKPFATKIGDGANTDITLETALAANIAASANNAAYDLDGDATIANEASGSVVVQAVITGVTLNDARDLNDRIDGPALGVPAPATTEDVLGRVKYADYTGTATNAVYVYLTHR